MNLLITNFLYYFLLPHLKSSLLTVVGPLVSAKRLGWSKDELIKNLPFGSPTLATGAYEPTKHAGGSHGGCS